MLIRRRYRPHAAVCELCGAEIIPGDDCYRMPDGAVICGEFDCLEEWARDYLCRGETEETEDGYDGSF